jgi:hypothetical protein
MALNIVIAPSPDKIREYPVPATTVAGTPLIVAGKPAVTLTARGDVTGSVSTGSGTLTRPIGGIGNKSDSATVAFDGVALFPVVGATSATVKGTAVYITSAGALTLTEATNTPYGVVYDPNPSAAATAVEIGA